MLLKISEHIRVCLARASEARERAQATSDPDNKSEYLDMEQRWMTLAESYRFVERADQFLQDAQRHRLPAAIPPTPESR